MHLRRRVAPRRRRAPTGRRPSGRAGRHRTPAAPAPRREVRLIGGTLRSSKLPVADRPGLRPTPDRVRETLFNWLGQDLSGWRVLDAFAGSGALGFEARRAVPPRCCCWSATRRWWPACGVAAAPAGRGAARRARRRAGLDAARRAGRFELVLLDPPFDAGLAGAGAGRRAAARRARRLALPRGRGAAGRGAAGGPARTPPAARRGGVGAAAAGRLTAPPSLEEPRAVTTETPLTAVYPGTFDPMTLGHEDLMRRAAGCSTA
jgi:16S rRNA (guanine966-N2)-methyltransferase